MSIEELSTTGITDEILEELKITKKRLAELESIINTLNKPFIIVEHTAKGIRIRGILIGEGKWNGVFYPYNVLKQGLEKLLKLKSNSKRLLDVDIQHGRTKEFKEKVVGYVTKLEANDTIKAILHETIITDEKAIDLIKKNKLKGVSARLYVLTSGDIAKEIEFDNISLVDIPACEWSYNMHIEALRKDISITNNTEHNGDNMSTKDNKIEDKEETKKEELKEEEKKEVKEEKKEEVKTEEEAKKKKKDKDEKYPYPYPYPYPSPEQVKKLEDLIKRLEKVVDKIEKKLAKEPEKEVKEHSEDKPEEKKIEDKPEEKKVEEQPKSKEEKEPEKKEEKPKEEPKKVETKPREEPKEPEKKEEPREEKPKTVDELVDELAEKIKSGELTLTDLFNKLWG